MIVVNLFGTPGSGKSTGAAYIFAKLKLAGINAELVSEFAKDKVWEETKAVFENQAYIFGKQSFRLSRCKDKVDVIITDSPLPLSIFYNKNKDIYGPHFDKFVMDVFNSYQNVSYLLNRVKPYNPAGRFQTEEESNALKAPMIELLKEHSINYVEMDGNVQTYETIAENTIARLILSTRDEEKQKAYRKAMDYLRKTSSVSTDIILDDHRRIEAENEILRQEVAKLKSANKALTEKLSKLETVTQIVNTIKDAEIRRESRLHAEECKARGRCCPHFIGGNCPFEKSCSQIEAEDWIVYLKKNA